MKTINVISFFRDNPDLYLKKETLTGPNALEKGYGFSMNCIAFRNCKISKRDGKAFCRRLMCEPIYDEGIPFYDQIKTTYLATLFFGFLPSFQLWNHFIKFLR